jgi:MFS family permease
MIGDILLCNEVTIVLTVFGWGLLSDNIAIGRRPIYGLAFVLMGLSIFAHPIVGLSPLNNIYVLMAIRVLFALGMNRWMDGWMDGWLTCQVLVPQSRC